MNKIILIILIFIIPTLSLAQDNFSGVIQHLVGESSWADRKHGNLLEKIKFKTLLVPGDTIKVSQGARIKLITKNRCVGVFYGDSTLKTPETPESDVWSFEGDSLRWICKPGAKQNIKINGHAVTISSGEILFHKNNLLARKRRVTTTQGALSIDDSYQWKNNKWVMNTAKEQDIKNWELNQELPQPKESRSAGLKPTGVYVKSRWTIGPILGTGATRHQNPRLTIENAESEGLRAMTNFLYKDWSILMALSVFETENEKANGEHGSPPLNENFYGTLETFMGEFGLRFNHDRNWSWFSKIGLGIATHKSEAPILLYPGTYFVKDEFDYLNSSISIGADRIFFSKPGNRFALYTSIEFFYTHTISNQKRNPSQQSSPPPDPAQAHDLEGFMDTWGFMVYLAPMLQF